MIPGAGLILALVAIVVPGFFILMWVVGGYNRLVALRNRYRNAYAQIDLQFKQRDDLITNLVATTQGCLKHERDALEAVVAARDAASAANSRAATVPGDLTVMKELGAAESVLAGTLARWFVVAKANPELKANTALRSLLEELTSTETKVALARQAYNEAVMSYNTARETVSTNMIAGLFNFGPAALFVIDQPEEQEAPKVFPS